MEAVALRKRESSMTRFALSSWSALCLVSFATGASSRGLAPSLSLPREMLLHYLDDVFALGHACIERRHLDATNKVARNTLDLHRICFFGFH